MQTMQQKIKSTIKRSGFIVGLVRALRAGALDLRQLYWTAIRGGKIQAYLKANPAPKLHIGASYCLLPGWLNTDFILESSDVVYLDATRPFPFADNTFDYVMGEHMIEHIDYAGAEAMLRECYRVLKPGGRIRLATPDLQVLAGLCAPVQNTAQTTYVNFAAERALPEVTACKAVFVVNNAFRNYGHQFLYDPETLRHNLASHGFEDLRNYKPGVSDDPNLRGLEAHGKNIGNEAINQFETFVVEARVPAEKQKK
jgi:predicted SAM-dependent methyltransferase